ncbi:UbiH/UbiF/VisC/COQ6 family ubiquinone biosynthesis hydroxylase [Marinobacterium sp. YM272]|uniref:UbiH/UbiF/VisC/COQ6 family ubiquinone biosynthesis hydroxylase n=1 Tax=Marinobacterium sp. YM272 TaxID=3421654 RepID=UPI003D7F298C
MNQRYDVVIVGGGMVGATLACALAAGDLSIALIEQQYPPAFLPDQPHDLRVSALSLASERILRHLGAWQGIESRRLCPYRRMRIWEASDKRGATEFDASRIDQPYLGNIVENRVIQLALLDRVKQLENIDLICPARITGIDYSPGASIVQLEDGREIIGRLMVAADGGQSRVREAVGIGTHKWDYNQYALVASVTTGYEQQDITWQQFTPTGPLAFLPLSGSRASLVWYNTPNEVRRLMALPDNLFMAELRETFPERLGPVPELLDRGYFPLKRQHAQHYVAEGVALAGDAAHMIHPLAGQGVNIGLLDSAVLAEEVLQARAAGEAWESVEVLKRYEARRRKHNLVMMQTMDAFYRVFSNDIGPLKLVRNLGLGLAGRLPLAKERVMQFAMGLEGDLPEVAR